MMTSSALGNDTTTHPNFTHGGAGPRKSLDQMRHARNIWLLTWRCQGSPLSYSYSTYPRPSFVVSGLSAPWSMLVHTAGVPQQTCQPSFSLQPATVLCRHLGTHSIRYLPLKGGRPSRVQISKYCKQPAWLYCAVSGQWEQVGTLAALTSWFFLAVA